jgi:hypothetical protein
VGITGSDRRTENTANLRDFYFSLNLSLVMKSGTTRWMGLMARIGEKRSTGRVLMGKPKGKRPLRRPGPNWKDNIKMDPVI